MKDAIGTVADNALSTALAQEENGVIKPQEVF